MALPKNKTKTLLSNILWPTDLCVSSERSLPYILPLARRYGARIFVLHFVPAIPACSVSSSRDLFEKGRRRAEGMLGRLQSSGRLDGVRHLLLVREGESGETLRRTIQDYGIDLIVTSSGVRAGGRELLHDVVSERVVRQAPCPVLSVGTKCHREFGLDAKVRNIVCATDLSHDSLAAFYCSLSLARDHRAGLTLLYSMENAVAENQKRHRLLKDLKSELATLEPAGVEKGGEINLAGGFGPPATRILSAAQERQADLIVLGTRSTSGLRGRRTSHTAHSVMSNASCPVLTVPSLLDEAVSLEGTTLDEMNRRAA